MKKKILALLIAFVMVFGMNTIVLAVDVPVVGNDKNIPAEVSLEWNKSVPGFLKINHVSADVDNIWYRLSLYRDGVLVKKNAETAIWNRGDADVIEEIDFVEYIVESGDYHVEVEARYRCFNEDGDTTYSRIVFGKSDVFTYVNPGKLPTPANVSLNAEGIYTFDVVANASYYMVEFCADYATNELEDSYMYGTRLTNADSQDGKTISCDVSDLIHRIQIENEKLGNDYEIDYSVKVMAFTDNIVTVRDSEWSEGILVYKYRFSDEDANEKIASAFEEENVEDVKDVLMYSFSETLAKKLIADTTFTANMKTADDQYKELVDYIEPVSSTDVVDVNRISVMGAAMNGESGDKVQLVFSPAVEGVEISDSYQNRVALDIKLLVNEQAMADLAIPVMITMPIPTGVSTDNLVILHYHEAGKEPQLITPIVNTDGTMTFAVADFSTFVIANAVTSQPENGDGQVTEPGNGNGQVTEPGNGDGQATEPGNGNGQATEPGNGNGQATEPGNGDGQVTEPGNGNGQATEPGNGNTQGEEQKNESDTATSPKTGDTSVAGIYTIMFIAVLAIVVMRKRNVIK